MRWHKGSLRLKRSPDALAGFEGSEKNGWEGKKGWLRNRGGSEQDKVNEDVGR